MMTMHAPGNVNDLDANLQQAWTGELSKAFAAEVEFTRQNIPSPPQPRAWFFDAAASGLDGTVTRDITWTAFPKKMNQNNWAVVDQERSVQEEYCEWEVARDSQARVVRVTFTTETPDYYEFLWNHDQQKLLELYRNFVSPDVQLADLGSGQSYDPQNRWNWPQASRGALMHMGQKNNHLSAAMNLAAQASWPVVAKDGTPVISEQALIAAIPFGDAGRHSDPHIGAQINELVRAGNEVSFADPVGLYIDEVDLIGFETPDGSPPRNLMRVTRGTADLMLRIVFEAPPGANFVLGDVAIDGRKIKTGSQIAEKIKVRIRGAARHANPAAPRLQLPGRTVAGAAPAVPAAANAVLRALAVSRRPHALPSMLSPE